MSRRFVVAYNCRVAARCIRVVPSARAGSTQCRVIAALHAAAASGQALSVRVGLPTAGSTHGSAADRHVVSRESLPVCCQRPCASRAGPASPRGPAPTPKSRCRVGSHLRRVARLLRIGLTPPHTPMSDVYAPGLLGQAMSERDHKEHELKAALTLIGELRASEAVCAHPCTHPTGATRRKSCGLSAGGPSVALGLRARWACASRPAHSRGRAGFPRLAVAPPRHFAFGAVCSVAVECSSLALSMLSLLRVLLQERQS